MATDEATADQPQVLLLCLHQSRLLDDARADRCQTAQHDVSLEGHHQIVPLLHRDQHQCPDSSAYLLFCLGLCWGCFWPDLIQCGCWLWQRFHKWELEGGHQAVAGLWHLSMVALSAHTLYHSVHGFEDVSVLAVKQVLQVQQSASHNISLSMTCISMAARPPGPTTSHNALSCAGHHYSDVLSTAAAALSEHQQALTKMLRALSVHSMLSTQTGSCSPAADTWCTAHCCHCCHPVPRCHGCTQNTSAILSLLAPLS